MSTAVPSLNWEFFTSKHFEDSADEIEATGAWAVTCMIAVIMREESGVEHLHYWIRYVAAR